ncbi:EamA family transporter [Frischella sp. Ac48]|uniref:EamA family transporter n=1 Tax=Frischella japonica TaxID=2741544 RepID=A0ABR7QVC2_9GAMM|nr:MULTISPECIES: EamA family transporter [Frischella]MBC9130169.1 EamA family transporter [Frischella japonica]MBX4133153.1 EamA family transporter [Frischella sp. Ac48]
MRKFYLIGFFFLLLFDTLGQCSFKFTAEHAKPLEMSIDWIIRVFTNPWVYTAVLGYIGAFFTWMLLLKKAPIGPAFAASHLEVVTVMFASIWLFNEEVQWLRLVGAACIIIGIIFLALAEHKLQPNDQA